MGNSSISSSEVGSSEEPPIEDPVEDEDELRDFRGLLIFEGVVGFFVELRFRVDAIVEAVLADDFESDDDFRVGVVSAGFWVVGSWSAGFWSPGFWSVGFWSTWFCTEDFDFSRFFVSCFTGFDSILADFLFSNFS